QADSVADVPGPMSDVQRSGRAEPGEDAGSFGDCAHDGAMIAPVPSAPGSRQFRTTLQNCRRSWQCTPVAESHRAPARVVRNPTASELKTKRITSTMSGRYRSKLR